MGHGRKTEVIPTRVVCPTPDMMESCVPALTEILIDSVEGGAAVGFLPPLTYRKATDYWCGITEEVRRGMIMPFLGYAGSVLAGVVLLFLKDQETLPHAVEIGKLLVLRKYRRKGIGRELMRALEDKARTQGRTLLFLDTVRNSPAEKLYQHLGYRFSGSIPAFVLAANRQSFHDLTIFYKHL